MVSGMEKDPEREVVISICKSLVEERKRQGISQQRLSEMAGISRTGLRHIESFDTNPTLYTLIKISNALDFDLPEALNRKLENIED